MPLFHGTLGCKTGVTTTPDRDPEPGDSDVRARVQQVAGSRSDDAMPGRPHWHQRVE